MISLVKSCTFTSNMYLKPVDEGMTCVSLQVINGGTWVLVDSSNHANNTQTITQTLNIWRCVFDRRTQHRT